MKYILFTFLITSHFLSFGQNQRREDSSKIQVSETFWATPEKCYLDSIEIQFDKTYIDTNNIKDIQVFKDRTQLLHGARGAILITRKNKIDFISLADIYKKFSRVDTNKISFIIDENLISDTSNVRFEPSVIIKIDKLKNKSTKKTDHGFIKQTSIIITTQYKKFRRP